MLYNIPIKRKVGRRIYLNKEFERCCTFLAEMMEKYASLVLLDILEETQFDPDTWHYDAEGKKNRFNAYARIYSRVLQKVA